MNTNLALKDNEETVRQSTAVSRSIYSMSTNARRMIAMAMHELGKNPDNYLISFSVTDYLKALGIEWGSNTLQRIKDAIDECVGTIIRIERSDGTYKAFTWFSTTTLTPSKSKKKDPFDDQVLDSLIEAGRIIVRWNPDLAEALKNMPGFSDLELKNFGRLQSRYSYRFYEIAMSWAGKIGIEGNPKNTWYFYYTLPDLKEILAVDRKKYKLTKAFRVYCIDNPIAEINEAAFPIKLNLKSPERHVSGHLHIKAEPERKGRFLAAFKFICSLQSEKNVTAAEVQAQSKKLDNLRAEFPGEFENLFEENLKKSEKEQELPGIPKKPDFVIRLEVQAETEKQFLAAHDLPCR